MWLSVSPLARVMLCVVVAWLDSCYPSSVCVHPWLACLCLIVVCGRRVVDNLLTHVKYGFTFASPLKLLLEYSQREACWDRGGWVVAQLPLTGVAICHVMMWLSNGKPWCMLASFRVRFLNMFLEYSQKED